MKSSFWLEQGRRGLPYRCNAWRIVGSSTSWWANQGRALSRNRRYPWDPPDKSGERNGRSCDWAPSMVRRWDPSTQWTCSLRVETGQLTIWLARRKSLCRNRADSSCFGRSQTLDRESHWRFPAEHMMAWYSCWWICTTGMKILRMRNQTAVYSNCGRLWWLVAAGSLASIRCVNSVCNCW